LPGWWSEWRKHSWSLSLFSFMATELQGPCAIHEPHHFPSTVPVPPCLTFLLLNHVTSYLLQLCF
jgi:hypothetical protein